MPQLDREQRILFFGFAGAFVAAWLAGFINVSFLQIKHASTIMYSGIIVVWILTVQERVVSQTVRRLLVTGALFLLLLFILRFCRWDVFEYDVSADQYFWYAYYIPFTVVPITSLHTAVRVGKSETEKTPKWIWLLWGIAVILGALGMTNNLHSLMFRIQERGSVESTFEYGPLYYLVFAWCVILTILSFAVLMRRCTLSASRELWYVPFLIGIFGTILIVLYFAAGGSPTIHGWKLYNLQEAYSFIFIGFWEGCFQIGLIPTNTGYVTLYSGATLQSFITNNDKEPVYHSGNALLLTKEQIDAATVQEVLLTDSLRLRSAPTRNGYVFWADDLTAINQIHADLEEATRQMNAENTLLEYENRLKEQRTYYELHNRLYDEIATCVQPQLEKLKSFLQKAKQKNDKNALAALAVLGAYIKRRANLTLIAESKNSMEVSDLYFSIKESVDYLTLTGIAGNAQISGTGEVPSDLLIKVYDLFEAVVEEIIHTATSLIVNLSVQNGFQMRMMTDAFINSSDFENRLGTCQSAGLQLDIGTEDNVSFLSLFIHMGGDEE